MTCDDEDDAWRHTTAATAHCIHGVRLQGGGGGRG